MTCYVRQCKFLGIYRLFLLYSHPASQLRYIETLLLSRYRETAAVLRAVTKERTVCGFPSRMFCIFSPSICMIQMTTKWAEHIACKGTWNVSTKFWFGNQSDSALFSPQSYRERLTAKLSYLAVWVVTPLNATNSRLSDKFVLQRRFAMRKSARTTRAELLL